MQRLPGRIRGKPAILHDDANRASRFAFRLPEPWFPTKSTFALSFRDILFAETKPNMKKHPYLTSMALFPLFLAAMVSRKTRVGGQAIIEGVMMRSKRKISWAVRKPDGETVIERFCFISLSKRHKILSRPIFRGAVNLYESLRIGYKALTRSAQIAAHVPSEKPKKMNLGEKTAYIGSFALALVVCLGLFMYLPMLVSQLFFKNSVIAFNCCAGSMRIALFLLYLFGISRWKDIRRVFEYHGAEHKAIFAFEDGKELTLDNMRGYSTLHPRCGTSFLLLVAIICIFLFATIDSLVYLTLGPYPGVFVRFVVHLSLAPVVAGCSYEVLRLSDRYQRVPPVRWFIMPGLLLQKITTKEPNDRQLQVASAALKASL